MNKIELQGTVYSKIPGYTFIEAARMSGTTDIVPVKNLHAEINDKVHLTGKIKTRNFVDSDNVRHKEMYVETESVIENTTDEDVNTVCFDGYLCKKDALRQTPMGRTVIDFVVAVNHSQASSSYISCIVWSEAAEWLNTLEIGAKLNIIGRFQSRNYEKNGETKIAYEICVNKIHRHRRNI